MAQYFEVLGLDDHPQDLKAAKRAYAKQLRNTRPDEDPEGFMKLREALDIAKQEIAWRLDQQEAALSGENNYDEPHEALEIAHTENPTSLSEEIANTIIQNEAKMREDAALVVNINEETLANLLEEPEPELETNIEDVKQSGDQILMSRFSKAFNDPFLKNDKAHWTELLDAKRDLSIDEYIDFEDRFRGALINAYNDWIDAKKEKPTKRRPLSSLIENLIFDKMEWRFLQDVDSYKAEQVNWLKGQFDLFNRTAPREVQQARSVAQEQFEDDGLSAPMLIWRIIRVILIFLVISQFFKLFS